MAMAVFDDPSRHPRAALKGRDGAWRVHDAAARSDDGQTLSSRILLGPVRAAGNAGESAFTAEIHAAFASQASGIDLLVSASDSPEALLSTPGPMVRSTSFAFAAATPSGPLRHPVVRPRIRGAWCALRLSAEAPWAFDCLRLTSRSTGRLRP